MNALLLAMTIQGLMGAFDTLYHHEFTERIPWKPNAGKELHIHGLRNLFYGVIFASLGWLSWGGLWAGVFVVMLLGEIGLTLWDFVIEDQSRKLPPSERITHTLLAINYGVVLCLLVPELLRWAHLPTGFYPETHELWSWVMSLFAAGVWAWAAFDLLRSRRFRAAVMPASIHLDRPNRRILITGGTGLIGTRLSQGLIDDGHTVIILTRDKSQAAKFRGTVTVVDDFADIRGVVDIVINLAGESLSNSLWTRTKKRKLYASRLDLTTRLIAWIAAAPVKPERLINASAIGAYGHSEVLEFVETSAPGDPDLASDLCAQWEALANRAQDHGVAVSLVRLGLVLSIEGGALAQMLFPFEFGIGGRLGAGRQWMSWVHIDDVSGLIAHIINAGLDGPINATAPQPVRNAEFTARLAKAMHRPGFLPLPAFALKFGLGEMAETILLNGQKVIPARAVSSGYSFAYPDLTSAFTSLFKGLI